MSDESRVFSALLKYWRQRRGMSQLDLALASGVSSRHISFLETGRSRPSEGMVLQLGATLDVPLREQNVMLREAGFPSAFEEPSLDAMADPGIERVLSSMMRHHEPYPMLVMDRGYNVLRMNGAAQTMFRLTLGGVPRDLNAVRVFFEPEGLRPFVLDWEAVAREGIARIHREALRTPHDDRLTRLLGEVMEAPGVPEAWRTLDAAKGTGVTLLLRFGLGDLDLSFITTLTRFQAPQNVTLDEIQIESFFPADAATEQACEMALG